MSIYRADYLKVLKDKVRGWIFAGKLLQMEALLSEEHANLQ